MDEPILNIFDTIALPFVLLWEGGLSNDSRDSGGRTNKGITQNTYNIWRNRHGEFLQDVANITDAEVSAIYSEFYWKPCHCDVIPYPMSIAIFDFNVNAGANAIKVLQRMLSITDDGVVGKNTLAAINVACQNPDVTMDSTADYLDARITYYENLVAVNPNDAAFLDGWKNRTEALRKKIFS